MVKLAKVFKDIEKAYGKKLQKYNISFGDSELLFRLIFGEGEHIMVKVWLNVDYHNYEKPFSLILFKENIYSNEFIMKDWSNFENFYKNFFKSKIDYILGSEEVELDTKMSGYVQKKIEEEIIEDMERVSDMKKDFLNDFWFESLSKVIVFNNSFKQYLKFKERQKTKELEQKVS